MSWFLPLARPGLIVSREEREAEVGEPGRLQSALSIRDESPQDGYDHALQATHPGAHAETVHGRGGGGVGRVHDRAPSVSRTVSEADTT